MSAGDLGCAEENTHSSAVEFAREPRRAGDAGRLVSNVEACSSSLV